MGHNIMKECVLIPFYLQLLQNEYQNDARLIPISSQKLSCGYFLNIQRNKIIIIEKCAHTCLKFSVHY